MRFYIVRPFLRIFISLWLAVPVATGSAVAESAHGTLFVSMTVLPSCMVNVNSGVSVTFAGVKRPSPANAVTVACPSTYPFRASLAYGAAPRGVGSGGANAGRASFAPASNSQSRGEVGLVFTGKSRVNLPRLSGSADRGMPIGVTMLEIYY